LFFKTLFFSTALLFACLEIAVAQDSVVIKIPKKRGEIYFSWGYNRDWYTESTIHFVNTKTDNYDFTFYNAKAHDKPDMDRYWQPDRLTIPQYDMNFGYLFNDKHDLGIELSWSHLKYVMTDNQVMHVKGNVRGEYIDKDTLVTPDFVHLQHTNGNNYLMVNLVKRFRIITGKNLQLSAMGKVGGGILMSYTISDILGNHDDGHFHYHGWVTGASLGLRFDFLKYLFIQTDIQGAYVDYTNTYLGADQVGRSTQVFYSAQWTWEGGLRFPVGKM